MDWQQTDGPHARALPFRNRSIRNLPILFGQKTVNHFFGFVVKKWAKGGINKNKRALWSRTAKNADSSTEPLARPFARSLAPLTHFAHSLGKWIIRWLFCLCFFSIFDHSEGRHFLSFLKRIRFLYDLFLDAPSHLYKRLCPSVRPSVSPSIGPSVRPSVPCYFRRWKARIRTRRILCRVSGLVTLLVKTERRVKRRCLNAIINLIFLSIESFIFCPTHGLIIIIRTTPFFPTYLRLVSSHQQFSHQKSEKKNKMTRQFEGEWISPFLLGPFSWFSRVCP